MDKFFLGVITGLGSLVVPLLLGSLFLPGPDGTTLRDSSEGRQIASVPEQPSDVTAAPTFQPEPEPATPNAPQNSDAQWIRQSFAQSGFSMETPNDWQPISATELQALGATGSFGAAAGAMVMAITNSKSQADQTATVVVFDLGQGQIDPLQFMQTIESQIASQIPLLSVKESAKSASFADFRGASIRLETASAARLLMPNIDQKFSAIKLGNRMLLMSSTIKPGEGWEETVARMEQSLRTN